jgi:multidrug transporter EmrE-like cation transporter
MQSLMLVLLSCVLTAVGQITFKYGMNHISFNSSDNLLTTLAVVLFNPIIILGFVCFGAGAVIWLFALAKLDLSYAVPLSGLTYILVLIAGVWLFKEPVSTAKLLGTALVAAGIGLMSLQA